MSNMVTAVNLIAFAWLAGWAIYSMIAVARGDRRSIHFVLLVFFVFCGLPLAADVFFGLTPYDRMPNYYRASRDATTCIIYCLWMAVVPPLCLSVSRQRVSRRPASLARDSTRSVSPKLVLGLLALLPAPLVLVCFAPDPGSYTSYAAFVRLDTSPEAFEYHHRVAAACLLVALMGSALIAFLPRLAPPHLAVVAAALFQAVWLHGKRSILVICILGLLYGLWYRGHLRGFRLYASGVMAALMLIMINLLYQGSVREVSLDERRAYYDSIRIDFGRDGVIKQAIYAELNPGSPVLDYRAQSLLFYATFFVPRALWPEKPWPYAVYVTASALDIPGSSYLGWGVTTSVLDEFLSNFGWIGIVLGPLWLAWMCRLSDSLGSPLLQSLWIVIGTLFMAVHLTAFMLPFLLWCLGVGWNGYHRRMNPAFRQRGRYPGRPVLPQRRPQHAR